jgi:tRNA threonylcarbamoyl adenosine modification protein (Sua5/YciO/YrdC/YwlC family)
VEVFRANGHLLPRPEIISIAKRLKAGEVAIFPTDSVYTITCAFSSNKGIERICKLVGKKPSQANLSIICSGYEMMSDFTIPFSTAIFRLMKTTLPGPYTFIMKANVRKFRGYENRRHTVGVRIPDEAFLLEVIRELGEPLVCSSLHSDDALMQYFTDPDEIETQYNDLVDIFVEDGPGGLEPSTVVDCTGDEPVLVREGKGKI